MNVATPHSRLEVGVRELKNNLSRYLERVSDGDEVIVTDHGRPVARLSSIDDGTDKLAILVAAGLVRPPTSRIRQRPARRVRAAGSVSELVSHQRR